MRFLLLLITLLYSPSLLAATPLPEDQSKAVILAYHRIGEDNTPETSLTTAQFLEHVQEIENGDYTVLPLPQIISAITDGTPLPTGAIALTFEGAYQSAFENAIPLLIEKEWPFTVFYASDMLDREQPEFVSWQDLKKLSKNKQVTIGTLPASYSHIAHLPAQEILGHLNKARQRYREEFGQEADYLAYPFGEYSLDLQNMSKTQGFKAALGLHSGAASPASTLYALPRFSMTERYGDLDRFRLVTHALPLPATDLEPEDTLLQTQEWNAGFTVPDTLAGELKDLSCFISGQGKPDLEILDSRVEIRTAALSPEQTRIRLNCTMPGPTSSDDQPQWRWLGLLYHRNISNPEPDALPQPQE